MRRYLLLLIVTAVHITGKAASSIADELSFIAALPVPWQLRRFAHRYQQVRRSFRTLRRQGLCAWSCGAVVRGPELLVLSADPDAVAHRRPRQRPPGCRRPDDGRRRCLGPGPRHQGRRDQDRRLRPDRLKAPR